MAGLRLQPIIEGTVDDESTQVKLPSATADDPYTCEYFYLANTHASQTLYWSGSTASTNSMPLAAGKTILIAATIDQSNGIFLYGSAASTSYAIQPVG
jgi:hypothetical protein